MNKGLTIIFSAFIAGAISVFVVKSIIRMADPASSEKTIYLINHTESSFLVGLIYGQEKRKYINLDRGSIGSFTLKGDGRRIIENTPSFLSIHPEGNPGEIVLEEEIVLKHTYFSIIANNGEFNVISSCEYTANP